MSGTGYDRGAVISTQTAYDLGAVWYRDRMREDWQPLTPSRAEEVFAQFGLTGDFWRLV